MHIESIEIKNYRSFLDSGLLSFSPGFNLVVGANNSGKSSLLECMAGRFTASPHRSLITLPMRDEPLIDTSTVTFLIAIEPYEVSRLILILGNGVRSFPWPETVTLADSNVKAALATHLDASPFRIRFDLRAGQNTGQVASVSDFPATRNAPALLHGGACLFVQFQVNKDARRIDAIEGPKTGDMSADFGVAMGHNAIQAVYRFSAERLSLAKAAFGGRSELASDASNLAEVLNVLQGNPARMNKYCEMVQEVFPSIQKVSVRAFQGNQLEIVIWQVDPAYERDDLATPLNQSGTGVGQVLAILYIVKTSDQSRTIIIDEPGSFLNPGAARVLISILKRYDQHQYIIATHSPEIISELHNAPLTIVRWKDSESFCEQFSSATREAASAALTEVGAQLSDVFGFDKILWVEGQSDALSLRALLELKHKASPKLAILPVRDTNVFRRRTAKEIFEIYKSLCMGEALLPPAVLFLFDRDERTEKDIEDLIRQSGKKVRFIKRRLFENYLLNVPAITQLFSEIGAEHNISTTEQDVSNWLAQNGGRFCPKQSTPAPEVLSPSWLEVVDGATLLDAMFTDLSQSRLTYKKTAHTPRLTVLLAGIDAAATQSILDLVVDVI